MSKLEARQSSGHTGRAVQLFLAAVIGLAFVGFVVGIRQGATVYDPAEASQPHVASDLTRRASGDVVPATAYRDFDRRLHGPNRQWQSRLSDMDQPTIDLFAMITWDEAGRARHRAARAERRAFDGAPPVVPHPIDQLTTASCMACHGEGLFIAEVYAPPMSHDFMHNCTQCHVEQLSPAFSVPRLAANSFEGLEAPLLGHRAWQGAPPVIPHPTFMRENCMSCHGPTGPDAIRTTHPWQTNCLQCHAPSALLDQAVVDGEQRFLPPPTVVRP